MRAPPRWDDEADTDYSILAIAPRFFGVSEFGLRLKIAGVACARLHVTNGDCTLQHSRSSRDKVRLHRERLRAQGLRPVQIWVPDVRARSFVAAARKQSKAIAASAHAKMDQQFIDAVTESAE
jgi:hypothetical protein